MCTHLRGFVSLLLLTCGVGCSHSQIVGPLSRQEDEREHLFDRARAAGVPTDVLQKVVPPLTADELRLAEEQDDSCRSSYGWKNGLTYTGSGLIAVAAGLTIGGTYATGNSDTTKQIFGVTGGTTALFGTLLVAIGGIIQNHYSNHGCGTKLSIK